MLIEGANEAGGKVKNEHLFFRAMAERSGFSGEHNEQGAVSQLIPNLWGRRMEHLEMGTTRR